ncbi:hypothetical protein K9B32_15905 [Rhizobium sp. 3T7]|uniref:hypothetical protein n=1 Tax=Rhizobium sp. 3T7 TaxID=2874922 RepID=UPI001CCEA7B9|nr:hypothetical protein [Rhizobium sp. 3T7]MBZ9791592.1 hypothetical protein [Rhizobium sp. 3T7]
MLLALDLNEWPQRGDYLKRTNVRSAINTRHDRIGRGCRSPAGFGDELQGIGAVIGNCIMVLNVEIDNEAG